MKHEITNVKGIGPATATLLAEHGIKTIADLAAASVDDLIAIPGFNEFRSKQVKFNAESLLKTLASTSTTQKPSPARARSLAKKTESPPVAKKEKEAEKEKKAKKDKKKSKEIVKDKDKSKKKAKKKEGSKEKSGKKAKKKK
ncbi:MAG: helix-hairpin-helix domain-containing protein [Gammaproteobacteria bacterium]